MKDDAANNVMILNVSTALSEARPREKVDPLEMEFENIMLLLKRTNSKSMTYPCEICFSFIPYGHSVT